MKLPADLTGHRFGDLLAVEWSGRYTNSGGKIWTCLCDCGAVIDVSRSNLATGGTKSCGHRRYTVPTKHGMYGTPVYHAYMNMVQRCYNPLATGYFDYGGRGIEVCERWRESFENFLADVGDVPSPGLTLERENNEGNYEPGNVKWATRKEQALNRRA